MFLQYLMRSQTTAKEERTCTPAALILSFASLEIRSLKAPDASALAKTVYPSSMSESARKAMHTLET